MAEYTVSIDNEESSPLADALSITGRVNGRHVAALLRISQLKPLTEKAAKVSKQRALVMAFLSVTEKPGGAGERVVL